MLNPIRILDLIKGQVGRDDQRFIALIGLINDGEEILQGKVILLSKWEELCGKKNKAITSGICEITAFYHSRWKVYSFINWIAIISDDHPLFIH